MSAVLAEALPLMHVSESAATPVTLRMPVPVRRGAAR